MQPRVSAAPAAERTPFSTSSATRHCCASGAWSGSAGGVELYAKAEWKNPGGSVKDRAAVRMVLEGERAGLLSRVAPSSTPPPATPASPTP